MDGRYEFVTTWWQYRFSQAIKYIEFAFLSLLGAVLVDLVLPAPEQGTRAGLYIAPLVSTVAIWLTSLLYMRVRLALFSAPLPTLSIDEKGVRLDHLPGESQQFSWSEISDVRVRGRFRKMIHLNENRRSSIYRIEYYLFPPEQREEILRLLCNRVVQSQKSGE